MWVQVEALIVIAMNDSTIELASVPAFTAPKGDLRTTSGKLELELGWEVGGLPWRGRRTPRPGLGLGPGL